MLVRIGTYWCRPFLTSFAGSCAAEQFMFAAMQLIKWYSNTLELVLMVSWLLGSQSHKVKNSTMQLIFCSL